MIPINLDIVIKAVTTIASPAAPLIKNKLERNEIVIKLLKRFNLDPEHPSDYFSGAYAYTLIEYGVGKPKPILELFRQEEIKKIFRQAFDEDKFSIFLKEAENFLDWNILGDEIRQLGLNPRQDFTAFAAVFIEIVKRSRTPKEVFTNHQIGKLQQSVNEFLERLDSYNELGEIRKELAKLGETYQALQPATRFTAKSSRVSILAQQLRKWFESLKYDFENYKVEADDYFE